MRAVAIALALSWGLVTASEAQVSVGSSPGAPYVFGFTQGSPGLVANLLANSPCSSTIVGYYAVVSDLFNGASNTNEVMRCGYTASFGYYWRPQRTDYTVTTAVTGGSVTLTPLVNAPQIVLTGTLGSALNITPSTTNAYPGLCFEINNQATVGVFLVTVLGLLGGNKVLGALGTQKVCYTGSGYQPF